MLFYSDIRSNDIVNRKMLGRKFPAPPFSNQPITPVGADQILKAFIFNKVFSFKGKLKRSKDSLPVKVINTSLGNVIMKNSH